MKKFFMVLLALIMFFCIGCGKNNRLAYNESPYTSETAVKNGDVVNVQGRQFNAEKLEKFMENVKNNKKDKVRITNYTTEGGAIITDLEYDGHKINYTNDTTRDGMGVPQIVKKKFKSNSIYKSDFKYYLKNSPEDILLYW